MDSFTKRERLKFLLFSASPIIFLFVFYTIGATRVLDFFPTQLMVLPDIAVEPSIDSLFIWAGVSVAIIALCFLVTGYVIMRLFELDSWVRTYSLFWVLGLSFTATIVLANYGNLAAELAIAPDCYVHAEQRPLVEGSDTQIREPPLCDISGDTSEDRTSNIKKSGWKFFTDHRDEDSFAVSIIRIKFLLNFAIQIAGIASISLAIILSAVRRLTGSVEERRIREAYLLSALILSFVILSDALFYDFLLDASQSKGSGYIARQRGLLFYYAIVSSTTLGLALSFCSIVGQVPLMLSSRKKEGGIDLTNLEKVKSFFLNPGFVTAFATIAPILTAALPGNPN